MKVVEIRVRMRHPVIPRIPDMQSYYQAAMILTEAIRGLGAMITGDSD
jgi:hypothetical protein